MKIVYFYQYFSTPKGSWGTRAYEFAKKWVEQGHDVTIVTSVYYKSDLQTDGLVTEKEFDGIKVKILNIEINNKQPAYYRIWTFIKYSILSSWYALKLQSDVVLASSGPITVGIPGLIAKLFKRKKFVFEVRDLWPHFPVQVGVLTNPIVIKFAYWFEKICYKYADLIVVLSPGAKDEIAERYGFNHSISITNVADNALFGRSSDKEWSLPNAFLGKKLAIYTGNIGQTNNSKLLFEAAKILRAKGRKDIVILLIGDGQQKDELFEKAITNELETFKILDLMPKTELVNWVQWSMCTVIPLTDIPVIKHSSPNKLFDALAAGKPVIQTTDGWIKTLLREHNCGYTISSDDPEKLANILIEMADNPKKVKVMGKNAKKLAVNEFDKNTLATKMLNAMQNLI